MKDWKEWLIIESQQLTQWLKAQPYAQTISDMISHTEPISSFLKWLDDANTIRLQPGKRGVWILPRQMEYQANWNPRHAETPELGGFMQMPVKPVVSRSEYRIPVVVVARVGNDVHLERTDGKDWSEIMHKMPAFTDYKTKKTVEIDAYKVRMINPEPNRRYLNWFTYLAISKNTRGWQGVSRFATALWDMAGDWIKNSVKNNQIQGKLNTTEITWDSLKSLGKGETDDRMPKKLRSNKPGGEGRVIIDFGTGWKWLSLDRGSCKAEGDAAGHCGNVPSEQAGDNVLSLRDNDNRVHLTFILDKDGRLIEMKAPGNNKPHAYTHKFIARLLEEPMIKRVGGGRYDPASDFDLGDLSLPDAIELSKKRPDLLKLNSIDRAGYKMRRDQREFNQWLREKFDVPSKFSISYDAKLKAIKVDSEKVSDVDKDLTSQKNPYTPDWAGGILNQLEKLDKSSFTYGELFYNIWEDFEQPLRDQFAEYFKNNPSGENPGEVKTKALESKFRGSRDEACEDFRWFFSKALKDANFKYVMEKTFREAILSKYIKWINSEMKNQPWEDGSFVQFQPIKDNNRDLIVNVYIPTNKANKVFASSSWWQDKLDKAVNYMHINPREGWSVISDYPDADDFILSLRKNIRYLEDKIR